MDPNTGEILGMASRPTFDPNHFADASSEAYMNRGVGIIYEPGSVFKPIMGSAGLMEKIITPDTPFHDEGSIDVGGRRIRNWDGRGLGNIKFEDIIKFSVNTGMASLGLKLGGEKETEYAKRFGFGEATGTDVPGEEVGILISRTWSPLTLPPWESVRGLPSHRFRCCGPSAPLQTGGTSSALMS